MKPSSPPRNRRWLRRVAVALAGFFVVAVTAVVLALPRAIERSVRDGAASLSRGIGRSVTIARVDVHLGARLRVDLRDLDVAARAGAPRRSPALHLRAAHAVVQWWPFVRGRALHVDSASVDGLAIEVVRSPDGSLSVDDAVERLRALSSQTRPHQPTRARVDRLDARDARVSYVEVDGAGVAREVAVSHLDASTRDVSPGAPLTIAVDAALLAAQPNLHLVLELVPAPTRAAPDALRLRSLSIALRHVALDPALALEAAHDVPVGSARIDGTARVEEASVGGAITVRADLRVEQVAMRGREAAPSRRFDAMLALEGAVNRGQGDYDLRRVSCSVDGMGFEGRFDLRTNGGHPVIHALDLRSTALRLERVTPLLPARFRPAGAVLEGPVEITASATGSHDDAHLDARVDLAAATVALPGLAKAPGAPLSIEVHGHATPGRVDVERLGVVLGPLRLLSHGVVRWPEFVDLTFDTGEVALEEVLPFFPTARRELSGRTTFRGNARIEGEVTRAPEGDRARVSLALRTVKVRTAELTLEGDVEAHADARSHNGQTSLHADVDATRAHLGTPGGVDKAVGVPLRVGLDARHVGHGVHVASAWLDAPGAKVGLSLDADLATGRLTLRAPECDFDVARLSALVPDLTRRLPTAFAAARARFGFSLDGDSHALREADAHVTNLAFHAPWGSVRGSFYVVGLTAPRRVGADLDFDTLDVGAIPSDRSARRSSVPAWVETVVVDARLRGRELRVGDNVFNRVDAHLGLAHGVVEAPVLRFRVADGDVDLSRTQWQLDGTRELVLHAHAEGLDLARLDANPSRHAQGRVSVDADLMGSTIGEHLERSFAGTFHVTATDLRVQHVATPTVSFESPLLSRFTLRGRSNTNEARPPLSMHRVDARFHVEHGVLRTVAPLVAESELGNIEVTGSVVIGGALDLRGAVQIPPDAIRAQSNGRLLPASAVPVSIHVIGTTEEPRVEITDLGATLRSLAGSGMRALGARLRERAAGR